MMKKIIYIILFVQFILVQCQNVFLDNDNIPDKIISGKDNTAIIDINRKKMKISLNKIPLNNLYDRAGAGVDNIDIYSNKKNEIQITGNCCVGVSETAYYKYIPKYENWLLYKTVYIENSANIITDVNIEFLPYTTGIDAQKYNLNKNLYSEDTAQSRKKSLKLFNEEFEKLKQTKNLKEYNFKYTIEEIGELLKNIPINSQNVDRYNDMAYYLSKINEDHRGISIYLLEIVIQKFPDRVVAYLNLGDSYWSAGNKERAKEAYMKYISLMKSQKKDLSKIPQRVYQRSR